MSSRKGSLGSNPGNAVDVTQGSSLKLYFPQFPPLSMGITTALPPQDTCKVLKTVSDESVSAPILSLPLLLPLSTLPKSTQGALNTEPRFRVRSRGNFPPTFAVPPKRDPASLQEGCPCLSVHDLKKHTHKTTHQSHYPWRWGRRCDPVIEGSVERWGNSGENTEFQARNPIKPLVPVARV